MDLVNLFMNLVAPPASFFALSIFLPPFYFFKFLLYTLRSIFPENVAGKVVLITGASSGIGEELAYQYAKKGACLALVARREERLQRVADLALFYGSPAVIVLPGDVSKADDCKRFVEQTVHHFGQLNHLVNNAGILTISTLEESTNVYNFRPIMDINFWGSIYPTYFAIPYLRNSRGKIVVTASAGGWLPVPRMSVYTASKAAVINFYECLRTELGSDVGITIVTPGIIESEMTQGKYVDNQGNMVVDPGTRDAEFGPVLVGKVEGCARGILKGVCRGDRNVTEPSWVKSLFYWKVLCPEIVEWFNHVLLMRGPDPSHGSTLLFGAKYFLYPSSIQAPQKED